MSLIDAPETIELFAHAGMGEVEQTITPRHRGRVRFAGSHWFARFYDRSFQGEALPGTGVKVVGREGLTLLVVPVGEDWLQGKRILKEAGAGRSGWLEFLWQVGSVLW